MSTRRYAATPIIKLLKCYNVKRCAARLGADEIRGSVCDLIFERLFRPRLLKPLHGYVFAPTHYCQRGRGRLIGEAQHFRTASRRAAGYDSPSERKFGQAWFLTAEF
ncbi:MAG: hypothetical protein DME76_09895 [Verrucomicrobia bacterium]|nr:MAG: hypothetical protein DME76_09895 [Verrucomicrobiota bacterium]